MKTSSKKLFLWITTLSISSLVFLSYLVRDNRGQSYNIPSSSDENQASRSTTKTPETLKTFRCAQDGVITIKSGGRLGNLMGEYATLWAIAKRDKLQPVLQPRTYNTLKKYFANFTIPLLQSLPCSNLKWKSLNLKEYNALNRKQRTKLAREGIYIDGYPTSVSLFHRYRPSIVREFMFKSELQQSAQRKLFQMSKHRNNVTFIGIHVRRTDYKSFLKERFGGNLVSSSYFSRSMDEYRKKFTDPLFVVVSDEMDWCMNNLDDKHGDIEYAGNSNLQNPAEDLALLAACNHSIITYGNFGFWGAYLAGGETFLVANVSNVPTELMHSISSARISDWTFLPA